MLEKTLEVEAIRASLGGTSMIGVLSKGLGKKIVVSNIAEESEVTALERHGLEVMVLAGFTSTGNLLALNRNAGIASPLVSEKGAKKLEKFFGVKFRRMMIAESDVAGACLTVTNKGFIAHPNIGEPDFRKLEKDFGVGGTTSTANYGDLFVGNSMVANSNGCLVGQLTSGIELSRIDEALRGEGTWKKKHSR